MKVFCLTLLLLPLALAGDKRFLLDALNLNFLSQYVNQIVDLVGSDATEQQCEQACKDVINNNLLDTSCPFICTSLQSLAHQVHFDQSGSTSKRVLMDTLNLNFLSQCVNQTVDQVSSDATEQQCEQACNDVMNNDLLDTSCPFICSCLQSLAQQLHIDQSASSAKRFLMDSFDMSGLLSMFSTDDLSRNVNLIVDMVGSDATEQQCEQACLDVMASDLYDKACPFICSSFQGLVQKFHIDAQQPARRFLLDGLDFTSLLSHADMSKSVNLIVDQVGSDATEQQCEQACNDVMANDLLDTACPFICNFFQSLVQKFHHDSQQPTGPAKRFLADTSLLGMLTLVPNLSRYVNSMVDMIGSDATEQECERVCPTVVVNAYANACPAICTSFQSLAQALHLTGQQPAKRFLMDSFDMSGLLSMFSTDDLSRNVNLIVDMVGSDATEQQCEQACLDVMASDLYDKGCPFICSSFQTLVQKFHIDATQQPAKRFLLDDLGLLNSLFSTQDLSKYVNEIVEQVGSDATEQQCEQACTDLVGSDLIDTTCPFICTSFQTLVHKFHLQPATQ